MTKEFKGKVVLVTGAASGLGRATALAFADAGASLILGDIQEKLLDTVADECRALGADATAKKLDLVDADACARFVGSTVAETGKLDALVNVAGAIVMNPVDKVTPAEWDRVFGVNVRGPFFMIQAAMPHLLNSEGGIVNIASVSSMWGHSFLCPYAASKAAMVGLTKSLAMEFIHSKVHINAIAPGGIDTPMAGKMSFSEGIDFKLIERFSGLRELSKPEELTEMILFLASPRGKVAHGSCLVLDRGTTAG